MTNFFQYLKANFEWIVLLAGLFILFIMDPSVEAMSLCIFEKLGIYCPGEGLGRSISWTFRGELSKAWALNPAGFFALPVLISRIIYLFKQNNISE